MSGDGARVLVSPRHLGDDLHVVAQGCQAPGVQLPEGVQVGADDVGNLGPDSIGNFNFIFVINFFLISWHSSTSVFNCQGIMCPPG